MKLAGLLTLLLLAACTQSPPTALDLPPGTAGTLACRLPFLKSLDPGHWQAGFINLPTGTFFADPSAPPNSGYFDRAVARWLPVGRQGISPDGRHYTYTTGGNPSQTPGPPRLHIVDAVTGADRVIDLGLSDQMPYGVDDYAADGIYIGSSYEGVTNNGLWRVDPTTGIVTDLGKQDHFADDGTGHAWVSLLDSSDPNPAPNVMGGPPLPNEIARRDLKSGAVEIWFYHPGFNVALEGAFVGGGLLAWVEPPLGGHHEYWLVTNPGIARLVARIDGGGSVADDYGIWLGGDAVYLFALDGSVKRVSSLAGVPAGGCQ